MEINKQPLAESLSTDCSVKFIQNRLRIISHILENTIFHLFLFSWGGLMIELHKIKQKHYPKIFMKNIIH